MTDSCAHETLKLVGFLLGNRRLTTQSATDDDQAARIPA